MDEVLHTTDGLYSQVAELIQGARKQVATQVNSALLATYWNVGRLIVEDEQKECTPCRIWQAGAADPLKASDKGIWQGFFKT